MKGLQPIEALKRAVVFASYKIGENGASKGFATEDKIEELMKSIRFEVHKLDMKN